MPPISLALGAVVAPSVNERSKRGLTMNDRDWLELLLVLLAFLAQRLGR